jgi:methylenetetrahydrofolate reductase (NADPH)
VGEFAIGVAAFPEGHPRSPDLAEDRRHLADKLRLADFGVTQFFFSVDHYLRMVDDLADLGVDTPVVPGLMLFVNVDGLRRMAAVNGTQIPDDLQRHLDAVADSPAKVRDLAVDVTAELCAELLDRGAPGLHLYTMNYSSACRRLYERLGWDTGR